MPFRTDPSSFGRPRGIKLRTLTIFTLSIGGYNRSLDRLYDGFQSWVEHSKLWIGLASFDHTEEDLEVEIEVDVASEVV